MGKRKYELKRRAERQEQTRQRIVEAAVDLHTSVGPASTSVSAVAERAGVQRHTYYRHFPDEHSLRLACSGLHHERDPFPDAGSLAAIGDPMRRLRSGLSQLYAYYERNESLLAHLARDVEVDPPTRRIVDLRIAPAQAALRDALGAGFGPSRQLQAALDLALEFTTWRSLVRGSGLSQGQAVAAMLSAVACLSGRS